MKKIAVVLALFLIVGAVSLFAQDRFTLDLSKHLDGPRRNPKEFEKQYDHYGILFKDLPANVNWSQFNRVIVRIKCFRNETAELREGFGNLLATIFYEGNPENWGEPRVFDVGANVPFRAENIGAAGSSSGAVSKDSGAPITLTKAPGGIMIQNASATVKYIEVLEITFFKN